MDALLTLIFGITYNFVLVLFFIIALLVKKHRFNIFVIGIVLQGISVFGLVAGLFRAPDIWATKENIFSIVCFVLIAVCGYFVIKNSKKGK